MKTTEPENDVTAQIAAHLPYLRRYARALTGTQTTGDAYAAATLEAILHDRSVFETGLPARVALFRAFHLVWNSAGAPADAPEQGLEQAVHSHIGVLAPDTRQALLLNSVEQFSVPDIAQIMQISQDQVEYLIDLARREIDASVAGKVLVIEDEAIIAMDIHDIVTSMGHHVTGIGRTQKGALKLGLAEAPDLILADIQLADNSSGIDAVNDLLEQIGQIPVIFITAFPERLLTGERPEPAFVIAKPYSEDQVRSAVGQALFFSSTETLKAG
ncbi:Phyllosphere-induced regulator PhyR (plasmid) [Pseudoseohaeicola sp. NH-UV-7]|jgi:DNA-directed RNA polymerase specialized sigma24 family protein|uniref:response regulator n=1 Tax=unclassified Sulfitobacter TaxID=196795 RepID=UPI000E0B0FB0|nr:response regulator [Sulfitobacter sp. JL08]AXI53612.1 response regulator [Sulfitobacter sp. JL08]